MHFAGDELPKHIKIDVYSYNYFLYYLKNNGAISKRPLTDSMENMTLKTKKYVCKFDSAWIGEFKCVKHSEKEESFAYRTACNTHLNISSEGKMILQGT